MEGTASRYLHLPPTPPSYALPPTPISFGYLLRLSPYADPPAPIPHAYYRHPRNTTLRQSPYHLMSVDYSYILGL
eukprot:2194541-Rhodomonas_salina.2